MISITRARIYQRSGEHGKALEWFARAPFATLTVASFLPIPIDVIRILAVSADYPRTRYALATFAGRLPRYLLLAYLGYELQLSNRAILIVFLVTAAIGVVKGISKLRDRARYRDGTGDNHGPE